MTRKRLLLRCLLPIALASTAQVAWPAAESYDYDPAGRLIRRIDAQSRATEYSYDAAGNITSVIGDTVALPPTVTSYSPMSVARNQVAQIVVVGAGLGSVSPQVQSSGLGVSHVAKTQTGLSFDLSVAADTPLGPQPILLRNAAGAVTINVTVLPAVELRLLPSPVLLTPDGVARRYVLTASMPAIADTTYNITSLKPATVRVNSAAVNMAAGSTEAAISLSGLSEGSAPVRITSSSMLAPVEAIASVSAAFGAGAQMFARPLGLVKGSALLQSPEAAMRQISRPLGIMRGASGVLMPEGGTGQALQVSNPLGIVKGSQLSPGAGGEGAVASPRLGIVK